MFRMEKATFYLILNFQSKFPLNMIALLAKQQGLFTSFNHELCSFVILSISFAIFTRAC